MCDRLSATLIYLRGSQQSPPKQPASHLHMLLSTWEASAVIEKRAFFASSPSVVTIEHKDIAAV